LYSTFVPCLQEVFVLKESELASKEAAHKEAAKALKRALDEHARLVSGLSFAAVEALLLVSLFQAKGLLDWPHLCL
jgi:hypothetical protein